MLSLLQREKVRLRGSNKNLLDWYNSYLPLFPTVSPVAKTEECDNRAGLERVSKKAVSLAHAIAVNLFPAACRPSRV